MRSLPIWLFAWLLSAFIPAWASDAGPKPVAFDPPDSASLAAFTLVDWVNGLAFDLDPRTRAVAQPHCNLSGGFTLAWPEADTDCDPEAVFEPAYELDISAYHSYILAGDGAAGVGADGLVGAAELVDQAALDELQAGQFAETGRFLAGEAQVRLPDGNWQPVPYYTWREEGVLPYCLEYVVWQPDALAGPRVITVTLRCAGEPAPELVEVATARLRLFTAPRE